MADENANAPGAEIELSVPLDTVCAIIELARDLQGKSESTLYDDERADPDELEADIFEDRGSDPAALEFETLVSDLSEDAQTDLVALMWLGRGDDEDLDALRALASEERTGETHRYLLGTPMLADYLASGLEAIGRDCTDWEGRSI
ncbi:DUF3775 domain-containing protein [Roseibacterium sp. SDUM158017]|uniref:DUF3775 domain-containing protein n=1 Tax=Roseicyclus salinarum TaxID=3036773 RepID=UPI0024156F81|nr:DUF3775 domain-containing protein [Roseibacterium sp. SDUM158017]MDG4648190.1 DUF3775 domain-containing protein [Roseibacterium sp. SDUM158017]